MLFLLAFKAARRFTCCAAFDLATLAALDRAATFFVLEACLPVWRRTTFDFTFALFFFFAFHPVAFFFDAGAFLVFDAAFFFGAAFAFLAFAFVAWAFAALAFAFLFALAIASRDIVKAPPTPPTLKLNGIFRNKRFTKD